MSRKDRSKGAYFVAASYTGASESVRKANQDDLIFTQREGGIQIKWKSHGSGLIEPETGAHDQTGWKELPDGKRVQVWYSYGFGWMTPQEITEHRRKYPRDNL